jgi:hypothetical protein
MVKGANIRAPTQWKARKARMPAVAKEVDRLNIRLAPPLMQALKGHSERRDVTTAELCRRILAEWISSQPKRKVRGKRSPSA